MEKIENKYSILYQHTTTYRGENIGAEIRDKKQKDYILAKVYTPERDQHKSKARFYKSKNVQSMREAKIFVRTSITEATTDIDRHLAEVDGLDSFFDSVDESVESLEDKFKIIEQEFAQELEKI